MSNDEKLTGQQCEYNLYIGVGRIHFRQRNNPSALKNYKRALVLAETQNVPKAISKASYRIGNILRRTGKPAEAIPYYEKAIQHIESTRSLLESEEYRRSYFGGQIRAYEGIIRTLRKLGNGEEAFNYNERARSRAFLDVLGSKVQLSRANSALLVEERVLQERLAALKTKLTGEEEEAERAEVRSELREAERAYDTFLAKVRKENQEQASLMNVEPLTLKEVQELLDPGTTLIEYFVTKRRLFVWIVEKQRMRFIRLRVNKKELARLVTTLRDNIYNLRARF